MAKSQKRYSIGAARQGQSEQSEREGYVPNVVYACGVLRHSTQIILP